MEQEYVFHLRCYYKIHPSCPLECYWEEGIPGNGFSYDECVAMARRAFRRRHPYLEAVPDEQIEVVDSERP